MAITHIPASDKEKQGSLCIVCEGGNRDVTARYDQSCYKQKIRHLVPRCSRHINSSVLNFPVKNKQRKQCKKRENNQIINKNIIL